METVEKRSGWMIEQLYAALLLTFMGIVITSEAWADIVSIAWQGSGSAYIFAVPLVAAWLFWTRRCRFRQCFPKNLYVGFLTIVAAGSLYVSGYAYGIDFLWHLGAVVAPVGCFLMFFGTDVLRRFLPGFLALGLLVPVPDPVKGIFLSVIDNATVMFVGGIGPLFGMSLEQGTLENALLQTNGAGLADAHRLDAYCVAFFTLLIALAFSFGKPFRPYVRFVTIAVFPVLSLVCNSARLVLLSWASSRYVMDAPSWMLVLSIGTMLVVEFYLLTGGIKLLRKATVPVTSFNLAYNP